MKHPDDIICSQCGSTDVDVKLSYCHACDREYDDGFTSLIRREDYEQNRRDDLGEDDALAHGMASDLVNGWIFYGVVVVVLIVVAVVLWLVLS